MINTSFIQVGGSKLTSCIQEDPSCAISYNEHVIMFGNVAGETSQSVF